MWLPAFPFHHLPSGKGSSHRMDLVTPGLDGQRCYVNGSLPTKEAQGAMGPPLSLASNSGGQEDLVPISEGLLFPTPSALSLATFPTVFPVPSHQ